MKTIVMYYSYTGHTRLLAEKTADEQEADLKEVKESKKRGVINAYVKGSLAAMKQTASETEPIDTDFSGYKKVIVMAPIWAGSPAPAANTIIEALPTGKEVEFYAVSASGRSTGEEKVRRLVERKGCSLLAYHDVKG